MDVRILRISDEDECVRGVMLVNGSPHFTTLELPWRQNQRNISCIRPGRYECFKRQARTGLTAGLCMAYELREVEGRSGILIHVANSASDLEGCIGIGTAFANKPFPMITESQTAYKRFMKMFEAVDSFEVRVTDYIPGRYKRASCE